LLKALQKLKAVLNQMLHQTKLQEKDQLQKDQLKKLPLKEEKEEDKPKNEEENLITFCFVITPCALCIIIYFFYYFFLGGYLTIFFCQS
jgi:hypothetical protein